MFPLPCPATSLASTSSSSRRSSSSPSKFVETALCTTGPLALSYVHHGLKWVIRDHLLSLLREFPSLEPSADHFTHDDGTTVRLLNASGSLPLPTAAPSPSAAAVIELTIWLHQSYPFAPPIVYLSAAGGGRGHPFVDSSSGAAAATPYLQTWQYPYSNLLDLARNLVHVFACYPVADLRPTPPPPRRPHHAVVGAGTLASRREALDRLYASLSAGMAVFRAQVEEDVASLVSVQTELRGRSRALDGARGELEKEEEGLRGLVADAEESAGVLRDWLRAVHRAVPLPPAGDAPAPEEAFDLGVGVAIDGAGRSSWCLLDGEAACRAIDDAVEAVDKALGKGAVPFDGYLRQVRNLSREQFLHMAAMSSSTKLRDFLRSPARPVDQFDSEVPPVRR